MKKKILYAFTLAFVMLFNVFAGCTFTGTNTTKYYNTIVATAGDDIEITKYQLMNAYQSYGSQYVSTYNLTNEEAYERLLNEIIDSEILSKYIEDNYQQIFGSQGLESWEESEIWQNVFNYVNNTELLSYVNQIRKDKGLEEVSTSSTSTDSTERFLREPYERKIRVYQNLNGEIVKVTKLATEHSTQSKVKKADFEYSYFGNHTELEEQINALALKQFKYYLSQSSEKENLSESELLSEHLDSLYKNYKKSYLTTKFKENYEDNKEISLDSILDKAKELLKADAQKYEGEREEYIKAVQSDASKIYFHPYEDELIYVSHILVKYDYNDTNYNLKEVYKTQFENGQISSSEYDYRLSDENLGANCKVYQMVDGVFEDEPTTMNANQLFEVIANDINNTKGTDNKLDKFLDYAYKYNQDTGMFSSNDLYTIQLDTTITDTMVAEFADLSRKLYNENGVGSIGICYTQYGAHIIYIAGKVENKIVNSVSPSVLSGLTVDRLENALARLGYNKTMLDVIADLVIVDDYSTYESQVIEQAKKQMQDNGVKIVINKDKFKDLY